MQIYFGNYTRNNVNKKCDRLNFNQTHFGPKRTIKSHIFFTKKLAIKFPFYVHLVHL